LPEVRPGTGLQLIEISVDPEAKVASNLIRVDTIEIELLDSSNRVLATTSKQAAMVWARPRE
jgi:hypothetical protein